MLAGNVVSPGTVALATMTAGTCAATASLNGSSPALRNWLHEGVAAAITSVFPVAPPRPGKCLTTASTPPAASPAAKARPSAEAILSSALKERVPSGSRLLGPGPPSTSSTGARSTVTPAARMRVASW